LFQIEYKTNINRPIAEVFARLVDIDGYPDWLPTSRIFLDCKQTSPGPVQVGTTFIDKTPAGTFTGAVVQFEKPTKVVFHNRLSWLGLPVLETFPGYHLEQTKPGTTVRHFGHGQCFGLFKLLAGHVAKLAREERRRTLYALKETLEA
jgi:uncharacterized protein YndB with AHSA1/START domain